MFVRSSLGGTASATGPSSSPVSWQITGTAIHIGLGLALMVQNNSEDTAVCWCYVPTALGSVVPCLVMQCTNMYKPEDLQSLHFRNSISLEAASVCSTAVPDEGWNWADRTCAVERQGTTSCGKEESPPKMIKHYPYCPPKPQRPSANAVHWLPNTRK